METLTKLRQLILSNNSTNLTLALQLLKGQGFSNEEIVELCYDRAIEILHGPTNVIKYLSFHEPAHGKYYHCFSNLNVIKTLFGIYFRATLCSSLAHGYIVTMILSFDNGKKSYGQSKSLHRTNQLYTHKSIARHLAIITNTIKCIVEREVLAMLQTLEL